MCLISRNLGLICLNGDLLKIYYIIIQILSGMILWQTCYRLVALEYKSSPTHSIHGSVQDSDH